nr:altronate dehydratase family protein [Lachnospiraceae bacterium]
MSRSIFVIDGKDNVGVAPAKLSAGETVSALTIREEIPAGHKVLLYDLPAGATIIKYGIPIGRLKEDLKAGSWVHEHNLIDITEELCEEYGSRFLKESPTINVFPRTDGGFGVANYVMLFPTSVKANALAKRLSDQTGAFWLVADPNLSEGGRLSEKQKHDLIHTALSRNIYAAFLLDVEGSEDLTKIAEVLSTSGQKVIGGCISGPEEEKEAEDKILELLAEAERTERVKRPVSGLTVTVHCAGSDWTTALSGNPALGIAADHIVKNGGYVFMDEWNGFPGSEHILAARAETKVLGAEIIKKVKGVREGIFQRTGKHVEDFNPLPSNKEGGITTLVEKSTGNIKKAGSTPIRGILKPGEHPAAPGVYLLDQECGAPASTGIYGAMSGAHINVLVSGVGYLYDEIPHLLNIRQTGNQDIDMGSRHSTVDPCG